MWIEFLLKVDIVSSAQVMIQRIPKTDIKPSCIKIDLTFCDMNTLVRNWHVSEQKIKLNRRLRKTSDRICLFEPFGLSYSILFKTSLASCRLNDCIIQQEGSSSWSSELPPPSKYKIPFKRPSGQRPSNGMRQFLSKKSITHSLLRPSFWVI